MDKAAQFNYVVFIADLRSDYKNLCSKLRSDKPNVLNWNHHGY